MLRVSLSYDPLRLSPRFTICCLAIPNHGGVAGGECGKKVCEEGEEYCAVGLIGIRV